MTKLNRRDFAKVSGLAAGGFMLGFHFTGCDSPADIKAIPSEWMYMNAFLKIGDTGLVTIYSPNPEIGQNVKTSMPMIVAEELDVRWQDVVVEQAPLDTDKYVRQLAGGSQSIRQGWKSLRIAGATARQMLVNAAARSWGVDPSTCFVNEGMITSGKHATDYGTIAKLASEEEVPKEVQLKDPKNFKIIGHSKKNVDLEKIVTGQPLFGLDTKIEGMKYSCVLRPPAFGLKLKSFDDSATLAIEGVEQTLRFGDKIAVIGVDTWTVFKGQQALDATWEEESPLEDSAYHNSKMMVLMGSPKAEVKREDGDVDAAFKNADQVIERVYESPFLPHNCLEPMNFFAHITDDEANLCGPVQTPQWTRNDVARIMGWITDFMTDDEKETALKKVKVNMTRMGGGFGRRLYGDFAREAAEISYKTGLPIKLVFSREDDMTAGTYRPASKYRFKAAIKDNNLTAYQLDGVMVNTSNSTRQNNFPADCLDNYKVTSANLRSNITTGAWRAPVTNFLAYAEQAFIDEVAETMGLDDVTLRLRLLENAKNKPKEDMDYDPEKLIGVIKLAAEKSNWGNPNPGVYQGFSAYYSHNTYVAEVAEVVINGGDPVISKVYCAIDCGIVVNPDAAFNQVQGGIIDGIGHAMYGDFRFEQGRTTTTNYNQYRMIRMGEVPKIEAHFVESDNDPTGLGEPTFPPAGGAVANALYKATGQRYYRQPFVKELALLG
jgi:isoquinoline 1-oxidoreductase beta subunit